MSNIKPQNNLKLYVAALSTGAALVLSAATSAGHAQGGFTIKKNQLEQVSPFKARQQVQIVDESPIVTDVRRKPEAEKNYQINIPALSSGGPSGGVVTINPTSRNLPSASFGSNIPAGGTGVNRNLPGVEQGHLGKQMAAEANAIKSTSVRPIGKPGIKPVFTAPPVRISTPSSPAAYSPYKTSSGSAGSTVKTTADATGKIKDRDRLLK